MFRQAIEDIGLSIEQGTKAVPDDGRFHVLLEGRVILSTASRARGLSEYTRQRDLLLSKAEKRPQVRDRSEALRRERAEYELKNLRTGGKARSKLRVPGRRGYR